jgi:tRNA pseudouridine38-40 synthase
MTGPDPIRRRSTWRFVVAYHGARFSGWQKQAGARTIQGVFEQALSKLSGEPVFCRAAGRTDAGVHARGQLVSARFATRVPPEKMLLACASQLPDDVAVLQADVVDDRFDARRSSIGKRYVYRVHKSVAWDPFDGPTRWHVRGRLDVEKMQKAAAFLVGEHDFEAFRSAQCDAAHARRYLWRVEVSERAPLVEIEVRGNAFCRNMVRIIAGTLVDIGRGRLDEDVVPSLLEIKDRTRAGITAPPEGLMLEQVYLPEDGVAAGIPDGAVFPGWPPAPASNKESGAAEEAAVDDED